MSLYQCDMCGCVENTAVGHYHCRHMKDLYAEEFIETCYGFNKDDPELNPELELN